MLATYSNLETLTNAIDINPADINPGGSIPFHFEEAKWPGGLTILITGNATAGNSAGLSKRTVVLPPATKRIVHSYRIRPSQLAHLHALIHECDLQIVDAESYLYNGSSQIDNSNGGVWDGAGKGGSWVQFGYKTGLLPPDEWTQVAVSMAIDQTAKTHSYGAIAVSRFGVFTDIPAALKNVPAVKTNWKPSIILHQIQDTTNAPNVSYTRDMADITVVCD